MKDNNFYIVQFQTKQTQLLKHQGVLLQYVYQVSLLNQEFLLLYGPLIEILNMILKSHWHHGQYIKMHLLKHGHLSFLFLNFDLAIHAISALLEIPLY